MQTFYNLVRDRDNTMILCRDHHDHIFGAFCGVKWHIDKTFYGSGENFVFTFENDEDVKVFNWAEQVEKF